MAPGSIREQRNKIPMKRVNHKLLIISPLPLHSFLPKSWNIIPMKKGKGLSICEPFTDFIHLIHQTRNTSWSSRIILRGELMTPDPTAESHGEGQRLWFTCPEMQPWLWDGEWWSLSGSRNGAWYPREGQLLSQALHVQRSRDSKGFWAHPDFMGLLISNRPSSLNKALCMPFGGLYLFTVRPFIPLSDKMYMPENRSLSQKSVTRGTIWKQWESGLIQILFKRKIWGVMKADESKRWTHCFQV